MIHGELVNHLEGNTPAYWHIRFEQGIMYYITGSYSSAYISYRIDEVFAHLGGSALLSQLERAGKRGLQRWLRSFCAGNDIHSSVPADSELGSILLMRWDAIGDLMVCLPFFRMIRDVFPLARIGIVVSRRNQDVLRHEDGFHKILYDCRPSRFIRSLVEARKFKPDAIVDTRMHYDSSTSFLYGLFSGARYMLSAENRDNRLPFNVRVPMPEQRLHNAEMTRILLEGLGRSLQSGQLDRTVRLSAEEREFAASFWRRAGIGLRGRAIGINLSARDPNHRWPSSKVESLCARLLKEGFSPVLISLPSERDEAKAIAARNQGVELVPECPSILHAAAVVSELAMLVSPDTGLVHIASSYEIPVVGLYTPNEEHLPLWLPWRTESRVLMDDRIVGNIAVEDVAEAVMELSLRTSGRIGL
jgi:ADP-heptose:LPS heptosyltransferase